jgi:ABC-2 type transport system permease protein
MNLIGFTTILEQEVRRIIRVIWQTIVSPVVSASLYFLVFGSALGNRINTIDGVKYIQFIVPGLIMMNVLMNAFSNASFTLYMARFQGTIKEILASPISYFELVAAYTIASVFRAVLTGVIIWLIALIFTNIPVFNIWFVLLFLILVSLTFAVFGIIVGLTSKDFNSVNLIPIFAITPLSFLGGVFYSINMLPPTLRTISHFNPVFYMIDGLRYGFFGMSSVNPWTSVAIVFGFLAVFSVVAWHLFRIGYKLKD